MYSICFPTSAARAMVVHRDCSPHLHYLANRIKSDYITHKSILVLAL